MRLEEAFGIACYRQQYGRHAEAEGIFRMIQGAVPDMPVIQFFLATALRAQGREEEALATLCAAMDIAEKQETVSALKDAISQEIANILMPGEDIHRVLTKMHELIRPRGYLEIGVADGTSLRWVVPPTKSIGVDPGYEINHQLTVAPALYKITSNQFFSDEIMAKKHPDFVMDLAFIDGLHTFYQVLLDFINVEAHSHPGNTIMVHDVFPPTRWVATPEHNNSGYWAGDGWRLCMVLRKWRPELNYRVIATPPTGLGVIVAPDAKNTVLRDNYQEILAWANGLDFSEMWNDRQSVLRLVPTFDAAVAELGLKQAPQA